LKVDTTIVNKSLLENLSILVERLKETKGMRILKRGFEKAIEILDKGEEKEIFVWAPRLKEWLKDPDYVFWLGAGGLRIAIEKGVLHAR
jgi:hypothetical protein